MTISAETFQQTFQRIRQEIARVIVGQEQAIEQLLVAVFAGGHILLTGVPGLGRTLLVKTLAQVLGLEYRRMQFTPDLLPTDILGTEVLEHDHATGSRNFRFFKGPIFANLVLVDEINRAPTRTQSALLEVMQERQVTSSGQTFFLPKPFTLIATENSLDCEGVWRLGEAQVDRFMMAIEQSYPLEDDERQMIHRTTGAGQVSITAVASPEIVIAMQALAREVPVVPSVRDFCLALVRASRPLEDGAAPGMLERIRLGASPRASQALMLGGKVMALARGRSHVSKQDIVDIAKPVLAHRILMDVRAQSEGLSMATLLSDLIRHAHERTQPPRSYWTRELLPNVS
ncbi:MAG: MoxR family ATPase [Planctomycetes bacterium]|nr:MoxR family ATPase [Planctomycetota bacterium]